MPSFGSKVVLELRKLLSTSSSGDRSASKPWLLMRQSCVLRRSAKQIRPFSTHHRRRTRTPCERRPSMVAKGVGPCHGLRKCQAFTRVPGGGLSGHGHRRHPLAEDAHAFLGLAAAENVNAVGDAPPSRLVRDGENRQPVFLTKLLNLLANFRLGFGVEAGRGLVENQQAGLVQKGTRD